MNIADTIVAGSSAEGSAARMIVRIAGPNAVALLRHLSTEAIAEPFSATRLPLTFAGLNCPVWAYVFLGPRSYTGDDLVELHLPGNPLLARLLVETLTSTATINRDRPSARLAEAGEFTARAFLNGRLDLAAAEGVALTIAATHEDELRAARQLLAGELSRRLIKPLDLLTDALALIESNIDFAEDDIAFIDSAEVHRRVIMALTALEKLVARSGTFERLAGEPSFVLVGLPNAGKSTLLNALAGETRAIVSPVAGTTRDALSAQVALPRGLVRIIDVAGLEAAGGDEVNRQMQDHARQAIEAADFLVEVRDSTIAARSWLGRSADLVVFTKADLAGSTDATEVSVAATPASPTNVDQATKEDTGVAATGSSLVCSAVTGDGMTALRNVLDDLAFGSRHRTATLALTARHITAIDTAREALRRVAHQPDNGSEIVAEELRRAINALGEVLGRVSPDDVLGRVFATFCVGK